MFFRSPARSLASFLMIALTVPSSFGGVKGSATTAPAVDPWEVQQPAVEKIDLGMYARIRDEGFNHSHVMEYASALTDDIGPRLTASPNMAKANAWTRDQLTAMGCVNAHLDDWGEFGQGWQQLNTWVRMAAPDTAVFIAQAVPWSAPTAGPVTGDAVYLEISDEKDFDKYRGKLAGKIALLGAMRAVEPVDQPLFRRYTDEQLEELAKFEAPVGRGPGAATAMLAERRRLAAMGPKIAQFLADEKVAAVVRPSRDGRLNGGSGGTIFDDNGSFLNRTPYKAGQADKVPAVVMAIENYGRVYRLLQAHVPVSLQVDVETKTSGEHEHGFDTVAEIAGTDPKLKDQVVMVGGHLDSWIAGTGATDNGAGSLVAMEAMRILTALKVQPRRTIRIALWSGEEQGLFGSKGYVKEHFGSAEPKPGQEAVPEYQRETGALVLKAEQKTISGYFNVDNGTGRLRGVYLQEGAAEAPIFKQWMEPLKDLGMTTLTMRNTGGTDHLSFDAVGIPGFQFIQDPMDYDTRTHHSNMDTFERLQADDLRQAAVVEAIFLYNTAMRDEMLPRKPLPQPELREQQMKPLPSIFPGAVE